VFTALVRITGAGRLEDFRERVRWLMVRDADAEDYSEHHAEGSLEYRFAPKKGIPFPAFTAASRDFPELRVEAEWDHEGVRGCAVIENGRLVEQESAEPGEAGVDVEVAADARLVLALVCHNGAGYAATSDRHTYFRYREGELELIDPETHDEELEALAFGFVDDWLWYDEEEAPLERAHYTNRGYPVRGANVKAEKLAILERRGGQYSSLDAVGSDARVVLVEEWLNRP